VKYFNNKLGLSTKSNGSNRNSGQTVIQSLWGLNTTETVQTKQYGLNNQRLLRDWKDYHILNMILTIYFLAYFPEFIAVLHMCTTVCLFILYFCIVLVFLLCLYYTSTPILIFYSILYFIVFYCNIILFCWANQFKC